MRGELQRHFVEPDINVWMVIELLSPLGNAIDESDAVQESCELECPKYCMTAFLPIWNGF